MVLVFADLSNFVFGIILETHQNCALFFFSSFCIGHFARQLKHKSMVSYILYSIFATNVAYYIFGLRKWRRIVQKTRKQDKQMSDLLPIIP
jgi:biotin transporter BioY